MDATENDHVGGGLRGFARKAERVTDVVGDVLDFRAFVVVGEDDRVLQAAESANLLVELGEGGVVGLGVGGRCG